MKANHEFGNLIRLGDPAHANVTINCIQNSAGKYKGVWGM